jgi:hypothetical protein
MARTSDQQSVGQEFESTRILELNKIFYMCNFKYIIQTTDSNTVI